MRNKYGVRKDSRAYTIDTINDQAIRIIEKWLTIKIVRKNRPRQCTLGVITSTEQCVLGVQMNWSIFMLNEPMEDAVLVQEDDTMFTYY